MTPQASSRAKPSLWLAVGLIATLFSQRLPAEDFGTVLRLRFVEAEKVASHGHEFSEPSGLDIATSGSGLVSVSDDTGAVFFLGTSGDIRDRIVLGDRMDGLEGIARDVVRERLLVVREDSAEIIEIPLGQPDSLTRHPLSGMKGYEVIAQVLGGGGDNNGLEGITVVPDADSVVVIKENHPRLMLELTGDLREIRGALALSADLGFVSSKVSDHDLDVSDIAYDARRKAFWISSDTGRSAFLFDPRGGPAISFDLSREDHGHTHPLHNVEGIAIADDGSRLFVVTDDGKDSVLASFLVEENT